jgi:hypothetical protein
MSSCNTENEKAWPTDISSLWCSLDPIPKGSRTSGARFNAITRLVIILSVILVLNKMKYWWLFFIINVIVLAILYTYVK